MALGIPIVSEFDGKGIDKAIKEFKQLETAGEKAQFAIKKAALPAAAALAGLAAAAGPAISAASDLEENLSKVNVIFGEGAKEIENFSKTAATALGQSQNAVLQAAGTFGTFGKAAGLGGVELAKFSNDFTALASDLASFNNTTPEEAINAIGAALRGEAEPLRRFGVLLDDATLKAAAMSLGIYEGSGALTAQQKVLAAQKVIFEQTTDAQGDFARTSDGLANSSRVLKAQLADLQVAVGKGLLPVVQAILPPLKQFAAWAAENPQQFLFAAKAIAAVSSAIIVLNIALNLNPIVAITSAIIALSAAMIYLEKKTNALSESWGRFGAVIRIVLGPLYDVFALAAKLGLVDKISLPSFTPSTPNAGVSNLPPALRYAPQPITTPTMPSMPAIIGGGASAGGGGGRAGSGGGGGGGIGGGGDLVTIQGALTTYGMAERIAARQSGDVTINVTGGMSTSAEIGQSVLNSLLAYQRTNGPLDLMIAQ
jgi:hypothetical protein